MTTNKERKLFHRAHYNILAAQIKRQYAEFDTRHAFSSFDDDDAPLLDARSTLEHFAVALAKRLQEDNPEFDPILFLNNCSPNTDLYPLAELWDER